MTILKLQTGWSTSLKDKILVVVFPSVFSKNKVTSLVMNIKKILKIQNQKFHKIRRDGGYAKGFVTKDIEIAATSSLIEKTAGTEIKPGTNKKYDRRLYVCLTKLNAYICIYYDNGLGGIPNNSQNKKIVCCVFDELSAVSCLT